MSYYHMQMECGIRLSIDVYFVTRIELKIMHKGGVS